MRKARFKEKQIVRILHQADAGQKVLDLCREHGISEQTFYRWRKKYGGTKPSAWLSHPSSNARQVAAPTTAVTGNQRSRWKARTARSDLPPKSPPSGRPLTKLTVDNQGPTIFRAVRTGMQPYGKLCQLASMNLLLIALVTVLVAHASRASTRMDDWVKQQVTQGQEADLATMFPDERNRELSGAFLQALLLDPPGTPQTRRNRIAIYNAVFTGPVDLARLELADELRLDGSRFRSRVDLTDSHFSRNVSCERCIFEGGIELRNIKVAGALVLHSATFAAGFSARRANIKGSLDASNALFVHPAEVANFDGVRCGGYLNLNGARFWGPARFRWIQVKGNFEAQDAWFLDPTHEARFHGMKVDRGFLLRRAEFAGPVDLRHAQVGMSFEAGEAKFRSSWGKANFNGMKVGTFVDLAKTEFSGPVDFRQVDISRGLNAKGASFYSTKAKATFRNTRAKGTANFRDVAFHGPVDFAYFETSGNLDFRGATYHGEHDVLLRLAKVGRALLISSAEHSGLIDLREIHVSVLHVYGPKNKVMKLGKLWIAGSVIERDLKLLDIELDELKAHSISVLGPAIITGLSIRRSLSLSNSRFSDLVLQLELADDYESLFLHDMRYEGIRWKGGDASTGYRSLLALLDRARYSAEAYAYLEAFLAAQGLPHLADDVYVGGKERERREVLRGASWVWSFALGWMIRYGRSPEWALWWSLAFVTAGALVFRNEAGMERKDPANWRKDYSRVWYSLDLFLPFIDLQMVDSWQPKARRRISLTYMRFHTLAGWVLIPIGLAALTGIIK